MVPTGPSALLLMGLDISKGNMLFSVRRNAEEVFKSREELFGEMSRAYLRSLWKDYQKKRQTYLKKRGKCGRQLVLPWGGWISPQESVSGAGNETRHPGKNSESDGSNCSDKFPPKYLPEMLPNLPPHYSSFPQISPSFHILRFKRAPQLRPSHKGCGKENISLF